MKSLGLELLFVLFSSSILANPLDFGIQSEAQLKTLAESGRLRAFLQKELEIQSYSSPKYLSYRQARKILFGELHLQKDQDGYFITCVYCEYEYHEKDFDYSPPAPNSIPDTSVLNTEHTWPQSRFSHQHSTEAQKTDLHALFPATPSANSSRGNLPFGNVVEAASSPCLLSRRGFSESHRTVFEPPDEHKGNVARALFYFAVRYELEIDSEQETTLREWNNLDPVDHDEEDRNALIFEIQGQRNPFIDHSEWIRLLEDF